MSGRVDAVADTGFTIVEMLIASAISVAVFGALLGVVDPVQTLLRAQGEAGDVHQRLRAAADTLMRDVRVAASVRPYRIGAVRDDGLAGIYYRPDTIAVIGDTTTTYYLKPTTSQLMQYDGERSDLPMVDHVVRVAFDYFAPASTPGMPLVRLDPAILMDGPWSEDATHRRFDTDLVRVSEVRIDMRLEATAPSLRRLVADEQIVVHVALRNSSFAR
jgi:hypothetical protein